MQKLEVELKNTPRNTSLVPCSVSSILNKEESQKEECESRGNFDEIPSVWNNMLASNISEENRSQHRGSSDLRVQNIVYVLNMRRKPLMPTTQQKVNKLLKVKKAKVISGFPFTIQLLITTGESYTKIGRVGIFSIA